MPDTSSILLIRPSALGDVCRSVPVLVSLRCAFPKARIDWLVQDGFADAIRHHPDLTTAIPFPRREMSRQLKKFRVGAMRDFFQKLREPRYDLVIDCQGLFRSGLFAAVTRATRRVGYRNARELGWVFLNERHYVDPRMHSVDRMLELIRLAGIEPVRDMRLYCGAAEREAVSRDLGDTYAVIAPTSRWPGKRWPAERFASVAVWLLERGYRRVVVVGSQSEREQIRPVLDLAASEPRIVDRVGATSISQLMAVIAGADLIVGNDSAVLHMAVGFDRPAIGLYGPTHVELVGPYTGHNPARPATVLQHITPGERLDHKNEAAGIKIMERISIEEVQAAVGRLPRS